MDYLQWQGTNDMSAYLTIPDTINFLRKYNWDIITKECHKLNIWAKNKFSSEMDLNSLCDDSFLGQMSSFNFNFNDPLNNQIDFYNKYQIQVPFLSWNNKTLFRISIQAYNNKQDIYKLIDALKDYQKEARK